MKLHKRSRRSVAAGLAGTLVVGAFAALTVAPAQAVPVPALPATGSMTWSVSGQVAAGFPVKAAADGATLDGTAFTFPAETIAADDNGRVVTSFSGSATVGAAPNRGGYSVTIADPMVILDEDGTGSLHATVSSSVPVADADPDVTEPTHVVVARIASSSAAGGVVTATPAWADVLEPNSELAASLGVAADRPFAGKSFHPEFLGAINAGIRSWFYQNTAADDPTNVRAPSPFTIDAQVAAPTVTATLNGARDLVTIEGTNFVGGDENYQGVYVGVAESGGIPSTAQFDDQELFVAADWIMANRIVDGAFTATLPIDASNPDVTIKPGVKYSVYTWQAHKHTTDALDTETPIGVLVDAPAKKASKVTLKITKKATRKAAGKATVTVKGAPKATGRVVVKLNVPGVKKVRTVKVKLNKKGKATVKLVKAKKKGQYKVTAKYAGDRNWKASKNVTAVFRVK